MIAAMFIFALLPQYDPDRLTNLDTPTSPFAVAVVMNAEINALHVID